MQSSSDRTPAVEKSAASPRPRSCRSSAEPAAGATARSNRRLPGWYSGKRETVTGPSTIPWPPSACFVLTQASPGCSVPVSSGRAAIMADLGRGWCRRRSRKTSLSTMHAARGWRTSWSSILSASRCLSKRPSSAGGAARTRLKCRAKKRLCSSDLSAQRSSFMPASTFRTMGSGGTPLASRMSKSMVFRFPTLDLQTFFTRRGISQVPTSPSTPSPCGTFTIDCRSTRVLRGRSTSTRSRPFATIHVWRVRWNRRTCSAQALFARRVKPGWRASATARSKRSGAIRPHPLVMTAPASVSMSLSTRTEKFVGPALPGLRRSPARAESLAWLGIAMSPANASKSPCT
mmetsp:Transcript_19822/g.59803  ORF Transcript_19822/g.59803 Transcript_19822/m.59803 type:complete len:346 (-) Transcript_19822:123-1160(-)